MRPPFKSELYTPLPDVNNTSADLASYLLPCSHFTDELADDSALLNGFMSCRYQNHFLITVRRTQ
jgi:hypothetical protein